jgi:hypothetical protein
MKPEYIRVQLRAIHTANQKMRRYKDGVQTTLFAQYVNRACPGWHISEKMDSPKNGEPTLWARCVLAQIINGISKNDCKPGKYDEMYANYLAESPYCGSAPDDWKVNRKVQ